MNHLFNNLIQSNYKSREGKPLFYNAPFIYFLSQVVARFPWEGYSQQLIYYQYNCYFMEPSPRQATINKTLEVYNEIRAGLAEFYSNKTKAEVWNKIFWILGVYIGKDGPISAQAQKLVNFYLQNKSQTTYLSSLVSQHKELLCKVYDLGTLPAQTLDDALSSGLLSETISKKLEKEAITQLQIFNLLNLCVSATAIHFCEVLRKFKQSKGDHILLSNRKIPKIIKRRDLTFSSADNFLQQIFTEPVVLLEGSFDNLKPVIGNYLNIQNLFQVTSPYFKNKKGLLSGFISSPNSTKPEFTGKIINLNTIFDSSYAGREMIQSRLAQLSLNQPENVEEAKNARWSLLCCISEVESQLCSIVQKLPLFLRPKSNGDILSFCQMELSSTFKYQVLKLGYVEKPLLSEYVQVFLNVGKTYFEVLAFCNNSPNSVPESEHQNICKVIDSYNIQYSRVRVGPRSMAVVPSNCYYLLLTDQNQKNTNSLVEIVHWSVLPKFHKAIKQTIAAVPCRRKMVKNYMSLPLQRMLLSYLSHQYLQINELETIEAIKQYLVAEINKEQSHLCAILSKNSHIPIHSHAKHSAVQYDQLFCATCKRNFINYFGKTQRRDHVCMSCCVKLTGTDKLEEIGILHEPNDLRYPLTLAAIYLSKRKFPGQNIPNRFEKNVCTGRFMGSIENQNCKAQPQEPNVKVSLNTQQQKPQEFYLSNRLKELKITSLEETIISIALHQPQKEEERQNLMEKVKCYMKQIEDPESVVREICGKYQSNNLVLQVMWASKTLNNNGRIF